MDKQILFKTLRHEKTERRPWVVFSGVHVGKLKGYNATEVYQDENKLYESLLEAHKLYNPDGMPIVFDLQVEAEILGCDLYWADDTPPTVQSHPLMFDKEIPCSCKLPKETDGRLPLILNTMKKAKATIGENTAIYGLITGPFTLASHLRGTNIFMDMYDDPEYVKNLIHFATDCAIIMTNHYINAGSDVIAAVDPLVSQISPDHFDEFLKEEYTRLFDYIRTRKVYSSFFVCGDATKNIDIMCQTKPDSISVDENIDIKEAKKVTDKYNVALGGNIQLTVTMLHGSQTDNMKAVIDIIESVDDKNNLIVSPGCDMPYDTPIDNVIAVSQAVNDYENTKESLKNYEKSLDLDNIDIELPDYDNLEKPLVEAFTLDSATCAACGYMMNVLNELHSQYPELFDKVEYKFTIKENILRTMKVGVKHLPSLYLNGELIYSSLIPSKGELLDKIKGTIK